MSYFEFPHTRSYDGDLGYIIKRLEELTAKYGEFMEYNQIKFADPLNWDINAVYAAWSIVFDTSSRGYYLAKKPVPAGIAVSNTDYWELIIPFGVDTALNIDSYNPIANAPVASRFTQIATSISNVSNMVRDEGIARENADEELRTSINANADEIEHLDGLITNERITRETADNGLSRQIDSANARIDNIAQAITPGTTSADAELIDIRVGANGVTYPTAGDAVRAQFNDVNSTIDEVKNYPVKRKVITFTSTDFAQGYRHNQPDAEIRTDPSYTTTLEIIHFKKGDVFTHPTDLGITYYLVAGDASFYKTNVTSPYTIIEDIDLYIECKKTDITPQTTPSVTRTCNTIISNLVNADDARDAKIDRLNDNFPMFELTYKQGDESVLRGYKVTHGYIESTVNTLCCTSEFIECNTGDVFLLLNAYDLAKYSEPFDEKFISAIPYQNLPLYSGNKRWNMWIADFNGFVRFTLYWDTPVMSAVTRLNLTQFDYKCVSLGDSIFGNNQKPNDLPTYMQKVANLMTANCGFGGTTAATHNNSNYTPLSFWSIADAINTGDWSDIDVDWATLYNDYVFMVNIYILCHLVDWSKVRNITVAYGTNDWNGSKLIDNDLDKYDVTTYKGALRYGIEKIQTAYPKINIILLSPLYRYWSNSQDYSTVDDDSDNRTNLNGDKLTDFVTAMKEVAEEYHLPFYDNYNDAGINKFTALSILRDGTHLNYKYGVSMIGKHIGAELASNNRSIIEDNDNE